MTDAANEMSGSPATAEQVSRRSFLVTGTALTLAAAAARRSVAASSNVAVPASTYVPIPGGKKLRIAVVGGNFGLAWPWNLHPNCEVTAVADLFADRRERLKQQFRCDNVYGEFHPLLKDPKVDAVALYTYGPDHAAQCIDIMKAGKHAVTVIPAAVSLEDCQRLIDTVRSTGKAYMYAETGCHHPAAIASRTFYEQGKYGDVYYTAGEYTHSVYTGPVEVVMKSLLHEGKKTWRWGFPQGWYSGHAIGPIIHATRDRFVEVSATGVEYAYAPFKDNPYGNPYVNTTFAFRSAAGKPSTIKVHWMTAAPGREGADIYGTKMSLYEEREGLPAGVCFPEQDKPVPLDLAPLIEALPPELRKVPGHGGAHPQIIHEFVSACLLGRKPSVDVQQAVAISSAGIVGFQSALRHGEPLKIPDFGPLS
jgi:predicted dehydrogenase